MAKYDMTWGRIVFDDTAEALILNLVASPPTAPPPAGIDPSNWYPQAGQPLTVTLPAKKLPDVVQYALAAKVGADGQVEWWRYTWNGTAWTSGTRVNADGTVPLKA